MHDVVSDAASTDGKEGSEVMDEIPKHCTHTEIVRSVVVEDDPLGQPEINDQQEQTNIHNIPEPELSVVEQPEQELVPTPRELITKGLSHSRQENYNQAIKLLFEALKQQPEPALTYIIVSELSTLYQHVGMYNQATNILAAFIKHKDMKGHPGLAAWQKKLEFLVALGETLKDNKLSNIPYNKVPEHLKKQAFAKTTR